MEFRGSQSQQTSRQNTPTNNSTKQGGGGKAPISSMQSQSSKGSNGFLIAILIVIIVVFLALGGFFVWQKKNAIQGIETNHYQAVFLTNGQVYFGKIAGFDGKYLLLDSIYYLQAPQQNVQPTDKDKQQQTQLSIVKLGNELHGPEDRMHIAKDQVLFWENLKDDGKVVQAIKGSTK